MGKLSAMRSRVRQSDHRRLRPQQKQADAIYGSPEYRKWRKLVIGRAGGRCEDPECAQPGRTGIRLFADHIVELRDGGAAFDPANGMARCGACHTRKTAAERARRLGRPSEG